MGFLVKIKYKPMQSFFSTEKKKCLSMFLFLRLNDLTDRSETDRMETGLITHAPFLHVTQSDEY